MQCLGSSGTAQPIGLVGLVLPEKAGVGSRGSPENAAEKKLRACRDFDQNNATTMHAPCGKRARSATNGCELASYHTRQSLSAHQRSPHLAIFCDPNCHCQARVGTGPCPTSRPSLGLRTGDFPNFAGIISEVCRNCGTVEHFKMWKDSRQHNSHTRWILSC